MFGISGFEFILIILFALFVFGPDKLPEIAHTFGKALKKFNAAKTEFETVVKTDILKPEDMKVVRTMQDDFQSITSAVKNPMSLLNTRSSETAQKVTDEVASHTETSDSVDTKNEPIKTDDMPEEKAYKPESKEESLSIQDELELEEVPVEAPVETSVELPVEAPVKPVVERPKKGNSSQDEGARTEADDIWAALLEEPVEEGK